MLSASIFSGGSNVENRFISILILRRHTLATVGSMLYAAKCTRLLSGVSCTVCVCVYGFDGAYNFSVLCARLAVLSFFFKSLFQ